MENSFSRGGWDDNCETLHFKKIQCTISCWKNWLVETNDNCFQRISVEHLVAPISYWRNYHYWENFWNHTKYVSWFDAFHSVQGSTKSRVLAKRSIFKPRTPSEWIQLWAIVRNLPNGAFEPSSYSALSSWLWWSGNFSEADYSSGSIGNKQCVCRIDDNLLSGKLSQNRIKQKISRQFHFSQRARRWNPSWIRRPQKDLVANSTVCGSTENTIQWEHPLAQRKHCFILNVCSSMKVQMHLSKTAYCHTLIFFKKDFGDFT